MSQKAQRKRGAWRPLEVLLRSKGDGLDPWERARKFRAERRAHDPNVQIRAAKHRLRREAWSAALELEES